LFINITAFLTLI